jgi:hypothetical protein
VCLLTLNNTRPKALLLTAAVSLTSLTTRLRVYNMQLLHTECRYSPVRIQTTGNNGCEVLVNKDLSFLCQSGDILLSCSCTTAPSQSVRLPSHEHHGAVFENLSCWYLSKLYSIHHKTGSLIVMPFPLYPCMLRAPPKSLSSIRSSGTISAKAHKTESLIKVLQNVCVWGGGG